MRRKRHLLDYDVFEVAAGLTADDLFKNYKYFMDAVIPVAEQCGMKLALHPDDPPVKNFNNIQRMVTSLDDYKRAKEIANSRSWGANLCLGCCSELGGSAAVHQMLDYFLENDCLFSVHLRDVQGVLPSFSASSEKGITTRQRSLKSCIKPVIMVLLWRIMSPIWITTPFMATGRERTSSDISAA